MHIQFKGLLMGWYHVNRIGKGICLGNVDEVHYNEDFIAKHTPTKVMTSWKATKHGLYIKSGW